MKKAGLIAALFCVLIFQNAAFAGQYDAISTNSKIVSAINILNGIGENNVVSILQGKNPSGEPIGIYFKDLSIYGQNKSEAITAKTRSGSLVIYIHMKHCMASPEALAALIAHESTHNTMAQTMEEELRAWTVEARTWNKLVAQNPSLSTREGGLTKRLNYIASAYSQNGTQSLSNILATIPAYKNLQ